MADLETPVQTAQSSRHSDVAGDNVGNRTAGARRRKRVLISDSPPHFTDAFGNNMDEWGKTLFFRLGQNLFFGPLKPRPIRNS